jgi:acetolactate synthase-1/2/3 large subunit
MFVSGQVMVKWLAPHGMRSRGTQEAPTIEMVQPITKDSYLMKEFSMAILDNMIWTAKDGRAGPVWLDICMDVQNATI